MEIFVCSFVDDMELLTVLGLRQPTSRYAYLQSEPCALLVQFWLVQLRKRLHRDINLFPFSQHLQQSQEQNKPT